MKLLPSFLAALFASQMSLEAQGTLSFKVSMDGLHAVPPNASAEKSSGTFALDSSSLFAGSVFIVDWTRLDSIVNVSIFRSTTQTQLGTKLYEFTPGGIVLPRPDGSLGGQQFNFSQSLTSAEASSLAAGEWWVNVVTLSFSDGEYRGQIIAVPEPMPSFLFIAGFVLLVVKFGAPRFLGRKHGLLSIPRFDAICRQTSDGK